MNENQNFNPQNQIAPTFNHGSNLIPPYQTNFQNQQQQPQFQNSNPNHFTPDNLPPELKVKTKSKVNYLFIFITLAAIFFASGVGYFLYENRGGFSQRTLKIQTEGVDQSKKISTVTADLAQINTKNVSFATETQFNKFDTDPNKPAINPALYKTFTGPEFTSFYNTFEYTNVKQITTKPAIRSTPEADTVIQDLAEKRGYKLRFEATESRLVFVDGQRLQPEAQQSWLQLKTAAATDKIELILVSGYRSILDQKGIFNGALNLDTAKDAQIAAGEYNIAISNIFKTISIPGYSRHHTGYTIDLGCGNRNLTLFSQTECYQWLSRFNYLNAKRFGFLPSYPAGSPNQGPDPEAWEYVWVGERNLRS